MIRNFFYLSKNPVGVGGRLLVDFVYKNTSKHPAHCKISHPFCNLQLQAWQPDDADLVSNSHRSLVWEMCSPPTMVAVARFLMNVVEACDPDSDAMTPGITRHGATTFNQQGYRASWAGVPFIGSVFSQWGAGGTRRECEKYVQLFDQEQAQDRAYVFT